MRSKRHFRQLLIGAAIIGLTAAPVLAQTFSSGSTGADGAFSPTANTTLSLPPTGVFNFTTVNIPAGVTVDFQRNTANTPVTMLATGDVVIAGTILLDGQPGGDAVNGVVFGGNAGAGGPGAFAGGDGGNGLISLTGGKGRGPGGGGEGAFLGGNNNCLGGGGGYGTVGGDFTCNPTVVIFGGPTYGSAALLPLIGGSGGGGGAGIPNKTGGGGGGGGGAIVIASSTRIVLTGSILARGGARGFGTGGVEGAPGGGGSGGAVRLVTNTLEGSGGSIDVTGGIGLTASAGQGGDGRIRLEFSNSTLVATLTGSVSQAKPSSVFLTNSPALQIASVGGIAPPATPTGSFDTPDVILPAATTNPVTVSITASQIPLGTTVDVTLIPFNGPSTTVTSAGLSGTEASSTTSVDVTVPTDQPAVLSATATFTVLASAGHRPIMVAGERVTAIRVAATYGGSSTVKYITASGKEVLVR